jgi:glycosyl transferase family 4
MNGKQDQKITVFHLRCSNYAGGPETTLLGWLKYADHERFTPRVVFFEERCRSLEIFADNKVPVELIPWGYTRNLPGALRALVAKVRTAPHPILHAHDVRSDAVSLLVGRITGAPVVVSNHAWHAVGFKRHLFEAMRGYWLRFADAVVNVSADTHEETICRGVSPERSMVVYSGLDLSPYRSPVPRNEAKARLGFSSKCGADVAGESASHTG